MHEKSPNKVIPESELVSIVKQILLALNYLRKKKIIHHDIKAENIIFDDKNSNQIKIIDFGFSN